jgi:hypothetical protein
MPINKVSKLFQYLAWLILLAPPLRLPQAKHSLRGLSLSCLAWRPSTHAVLRGKLTGHREQGKAPPLVCPGLSRRQQTPATA